MRIGFIGAGSVTKTFGRHLIGADHQIVVSNSRGPETLGDVVAALGPNASAGTKHEAAACDIVILATLWVSAPAALKDIDWRGRILIDATNAHTDPKPDISLAGVTRSRAALKGRTSSEIIAEMAPGARLVKSISNMPMAWIQDFSKEKPRTVIFTSGDDQEAKRMVIKLIDGAGFAAIDLGSLAVGGAMHEVGAPLSGVDLTSSSGSAERRFSAAPLRLRRRGNGRERHKSLRDASKTGVVRRPAPRNDNRARPKATLQSGLGRC